jgi:hypothetical protein
MTSASNQVENQKYVKAVLAEKNAIENSVCVKTADGVIFRPLECVKIGEKTLDEILSNYQSIIENQQYSIINLAQEIGALQERLDNAESLIKDINSDKQKIWDIIDE